MSSCGCDDRSIGRIRVERYRQAGELERNCHRDGKDAYSRRPGREGEPLIQRPIQGEASEAHQSCDLNLERSPAYQTHMCVSRTGACIAPHL